MSLTGPLEGAAAYAARLHSATCTITRPGEGDPVFDPNTGTYSDPSSATVVADQKCLVIPAGSAGVQEFGEGPVTLRTYTVEIADTTTTFKVGDTVTVTASRDPQLVNKALVVLDVPKSEHITVRHLTCEEQL